MFSGMRIRENQRLENLKLDFLRIIDLISSIIVLFQTKLSNRHLETPRWFLTLTNLDLKREVILRK